MRIAIAGGTGTVGRLVTREVERRGHDAVVLARSVGVDLATGSGLVGMLDGADAVIDAASVATMSAKDATAFFRAASGTLLAAAERAGVRHAVLLSIVGIDRIPHAYYAGKLAQEEEYSRASVPVSVVRATQFHEFAGQVAAQARVGPLQLAPRARVQPIAADAVASHLVSLAEGDPQGRSTDVAGPQEEQLSRMVREWERHAGHRRPVLPVDIPSAQMRGMRRGLALPGPDALILGPRFADWLSRR